MSAPDPARQDRPLPPPLAAALSARGARLGPFARDVRWYDELPSTNDAAAALGEAAGEEGTVVVAGAQTAGRGRLGRTWCSPPGAGLYVSVALRPAPAVMPLLTLAAGVALAEGIEAATGLGTALKWPNDVIAAGGGKLAGILVEASSSAAAGVRGCVLGFGINLRAAAYPPEVAARAASIEGALGAPADAGAVLAECLAALASRYDDLRQGRGAAVLEAWRARARPLLNRAVEWDAPGGVLRGTAEDVDASGALLVRQPSGVVRVIAGEVRWT